MINGEDSMLASVLAMFLTRKLDAYAQSGDNTRNNGGKNTSKSR
jgi:hypothetical protein